MIKSGFINLNKPRGISSAQAVARVKRILCLPKSVKIGHMGTLDPMADGVLVLAIGGATRAFDIFLNKKKKYRAEFTFGYETDTLDSEGTIIKSSDIVPTKDEIIQVLPTFLGKISQLPPAYSAKNVNGKRAYDLARNGQIVELKPSIVEIFEFDLVEQKDAKTFVFEITCGGGTYIRSLCRDLAYKLNSFATMTALTRTQAGKFEISQSIVFEELDESKIVPLEYAFDDLEILEIPDNHISDFMCGRKFVIDKEAGLYRLYLNQKFFGICEITNDGAIKRRINND